MKPFVQKYHRPIFYTAWLLIGLLQSAFTELLDDEAYYWVFSNYLDWGYFDHPPMIAALIRIGTTFFGGELAVRLVPLLLNTATIAISEELTAKKNPLLFYAIALSVAVLQIGGFLAVPDSPLMFFTALFFLAYRAYLKQSSWLNAFWLGLVAAALLYSKYHAVLVLGFVLLSNLKLLRDVKVYVAGALALLLFLPHLWWQYNHNWMSFRYHLFESNVNPYKLSHTSDYILGQLLIAGPIAGFILWPAALLYRPKDKLEKALKWVAAGFVLFFFISTFKGKVEANWTSPAIVPILVLSHQFLTQKVAWRRWLLRLLPITVVLVLAVRVVMVVDILPALAIKERFHAWKYWPQQLKAETKGLPVVFYNSYQWASKYAFYTGQTANSLNLYYARRNNYNFWPIEDSLLGKAMYTIDTRSLEDTLPGVQTPFYRMVPVYHPDWFSFGKVVFKAKDAMVNVGDSLRLNFSVSIPTFYQDYLRSHPGVEPKISLGIFKNSELVKEIELPFSLRNLIATRPAGVTVLPGLPAGKYFMRFGVSSESGGYTHNSDKIGLEVKP